MNRTIPSFSLSLLLLTGCASDSSREQQPQRPSIFDSAEVRSLRWLDSADPQRDVSAALARRDTRFIGVYGYAPLTPGVERATASRHGIRYLRGTSDAIRGPEHQRLNRLASNYATHYNQLLLQRLKQ